MVAVFMDVQWAIIRFAVGLKGVVAEVECDVKEIDGLQASFNSDLKAKRCKKVVEAFS